MGERLKELRECYGFTQQQVADYLEIDQSNYSKIEHGQRRLNKIHQIEDLCTLYDCTERYLLCESDDYVPKRWNGLEKKIDLEIIAQVNMTMRYLKMLRKVEEVMELRRLNNEYTLTMEKLKKEYVENG